MIKLVFDSGSLLLTLEPGDVTPPGLLAPPLALDPRVGAWRAPAMYYREVVDQLYRARIPYEDRAATYQRLRLTHGGARAPHPHQTQAMEAWRLAGKRGVLVLPTGSGKSYVAEMAIADAGRSTLVVAPTLDLMNQWYDLLSASFGVEVGLVGGGYYEVHDLTVTTYDSAYLHLERLGGRFGLIVFDECHHLPGPTYAMAAECALAPFRLGLTATPERSDGREGLLTSLIGPIVFQRGIRELAGDILADYEVVRIRVELLPEEFEEYQRERTLYSDFVRASGIDMRSPQGFQTFVAVASRSEGGRRAMRAFRAYRRLALTCQAKLAEVERLLRIHRRDKVILFTHENETVYEISRRFLIPAITHHTDARERKELLAGFKEGRIPALVTARVLNEGVDLPTASVGIVLSGSGSVREHVQRLGRILRRQEGKEAVLYEVITRGTVEERVSERRREHDAYRGEGGE